MPVSLSDEMKSKIRHHMGYLEVQETQTFVLGIPAGVQQQFMIEGAFDKLLPSGLDRLTNLVCRLDALEQQIEDNAENVEVEQIGSITINKEAFNEVVQRYLWWQGSLANLFGVTPNPNDQRFVRWGIGGGGGINVPVNH